MKKFYFMLLCLIVFFVSCDLSVQPMGESRESNNVITETDIISTFGLKKNNITASNAATSIKTGTKSVLNLTAVKVIAYDDEAGTFSLELTGSKNGKDFGTRTLSFSGFNHPYDSMPTSWGLKADELNLDEAIENNYSIAKFIEQIETNDGLKLKVFEKLSLGLSPHKYISYGKHEKEGYELNVVISEASGKITITPRFEVLYKKLENDKATESRKERSLISSIGKSKTCDYFTEKDVYNYLIKNVTEASFIVDKDGFASYHYAYVKKYKSLVNTIYAKPSEIDTCLERYNKVKSDDTHLSLMDKKIRLGYYIHGNIKADDVEGKLSFTAAVAPEDNFPSGNEIYAQKSIELSGFKTIRKENFNDLFNFTVMKKSDSSLKDAWVDYLKANVYNGLVFQAERTDPFANNVWKESGRKKFYLYVPEINEQINTLKTADGKDAAIKSIRLTKKANDEACTLTIELEGNKEISVILPVNNLKPHTP